MSRVAAGWSSIATRIWLLGDSGGTQGNAEAAVKRSVRWVVAVPSIPVCIATTEKGSPISIENKGFTVRQFSAFLKIAKVGSGPEAFLASFDWIATRFRQSQKKVRGSDRLRWSLKSCQPDVAVRSRLQIGCNTYPLGLLFHIMSSKRLRKVGVLCSSSLPFRSST